ncbi:MAG: hypothetical protein CL913_09420, partial [Deltaproteobacteria bacterium]|nr:hypothetical protein [Deltaproteobacteria bacterium]
SSELRAPSSELRTLNSELRTPNSERRHQLPTSPSRAEQVQTDLNWSELIQKLLHLFVYDNIY